MSITAPPPMTQIAADAYALAEPIAGPDAANGYPLAVLFGGIGEMFKEAEQLVRALPGREPWQQAFDVDTAPVFQYPWLGQLVGVRDLAGLTPAQQVTKIKAEAAWYRGGVSSLKSAVAKTLTGTQSVRVLERVSDADTITVVTDPTETPDPTATTIAAKGAKVMGLLMTVTQASTPIVDEGTRTIDAATGTIDSAVITDIT